MRKLSKILVASLSAACLNSLSFNVTAADAEGNYAVWGEGGLSCFQYSKLRAEGNDDKVKAFLRGYLTAYNTVSGDTYSITGPVKMPQALEIIDEHCDEKAIDSFDRAIQMMITNVEDNRYRTPNQKGVVGGWGKQ